MSSLAPLSDRALEVLWVIARNGHASEKVITVTLRRQAMSVRNRGQLYRNLKLLLSYGLIRYDQECREYVLERKEAYARKDEEDQQAEHRRKLWARIKDEHEFYRTFNTPP